LGGLGLALLPWAKPASGGCLTYKAPPDWAGKDYDSIYVDGVERGRWYENIPRLEYFDGKQWMEIGE
jgi:hypothetical protein